MPIRSLKYLMVAAALFGSTVGSTVGCTSAPEIQLTGPYLPGARSSDSARSGSGEPAYGSMLSGPLTVPALLELARAHHPALSAASARLEAARHMARQAGLWPNPRAEFEFDDAPLDGKFFADAAYAFRLSQELPLSGRVGAAYDAAVAQARATADELLVTSADVLQNVIAEVIEVLTARQRLAITQENRTDAQRIRELIESLVDAGTIPGAQASRARAALGRAENQVEDANRQLLEARAALADAVGLDATQLPALANDLSLPDIDTPPALADMVQHAVGPAGANAWLIVARSRISASREQVSAAAAAGGTDLDVTAGIRYAGEARSAQLQFGVSIPLRFLDHNQGATDAARAREAVALADEQAALNRAISRIHQAHIALESHRRQLAMWRDEILPADRETVTGAEASVRVAALSALELVDAQTTLYQDRLGELETRRQVWLAALDLQIQTGDPGFFNPFQLPFDSP
ncbi:MAG: TolC family protein [Planctomycetota bacterium]